MPKYLVEIPEVHWSIREVEADNIMQALERAGDVEEVALEYGHTLNDSLWRLHKASDDGSSWEKTR